MDGFPRTIPQADSLTERLAELNRNLDAVCKYRRAVDDAASTRFVVVTPS